MLPVCAIAPLIFHFVRPLRVLFWVVAVVKDGHDTVPRVVRVDVDPIFGIEIGHLEDWCGCEAVLDISDRTTDSVLPPSVLERDPFLPL